MKTPSERRYRCFNRVMKVQRSQASVPGFQHTIGTLPALNHNNKVGVLLSAVRRFSDLSMLKENPCVDREHHIHANWLR